MKALKLAGIFVILVAAIALALNWESIFKKGGHGDEFAEEDKLNITEECGKIRKGWDAAKEWDKELYELQRADIDQSRAMGLFSKEGYNTVNNTLRETAANSACNAYMSELGSPQFSDSRLQKQYSGVKLLAQAEKMGSDPRIAKVMGIHKLYTDIRKFEQSPHSIRPHFDRDNTDWTSFATLQNGIVATAASYRQNPYYKYLHNVPGFETTLNANHIRKVTGSLRAAFYYGLSQQIIDYFNEVEPTQTNLNLFNQIYKNFTREDSDHGIDQLAAALVEFKDKCE